MARVQAAEAATVDFSARNERGYAKCPEYSEEEDENSTDNGGAGPEQQGDRYTPLAEGRSDGNPTGQTRSVDEQPYRPFDLPEIRRLGNCGEGQDSSENDGG